MTEINPPGFLQNRTDHPARELRGMIGALISSAGIIGVNDLLVAQHAAGANMSVDVAGGQGYIQGTEDPNQGFYYILNDITVVNKVIAAAHASLNRIDCVVARIHDTQYSGVTDSWAIEVVQGTPGSVPVAPTLNANSLILAQVYVAAAVTSILNANITNERVQVSVYASVINAILTGTPTAPTAAAGTNTTQVATTAFIQAALAAANIRLTSPTEFTNIVAAAPSATQEIYCDTAQDWFFTTNATANFIIDLAASASISLATRMAVGDTKTFSIRFINGATPYYPTAIHIDGSVITVHWGGGTVPAAGDANARDLVTITVTKTAATPTYEVMAQMVKVS